LETKTSMATFLSQIFYSCNKFDEVNKIKNLENIMLTNDIYDKYFAIEKKITDTISNNSINKLNKTEKTEQKTIINIPVIAEEPKHELFNPNKRESLFWCIYAIHYGLKQYYLLQHKNNNTLIQEKQKMSAFVKANEVLIKQSNHKVSKTKLQEISSELLLLNDMSLLSCIAMPMYIKRNIYILNNDNNTYLYFSSGCDENENVFLNYKDGNYSLYCETEGLIHRVQNKMCILDDPLKPFNAASSYTLKELEKVGNMLGFEYDKKKHNKTEFYTIIWNACVWDARYRK
jgi:hypothetical protein